MCPQVEDYREVQALSNDGLYVKKVYDFSKDGGAVAVYDLMKVNSAMVIEEAWVNVKTAVVSGGAATVEIGVKGGDTDAIMVASLQAVLTIDKTIDGAAASKRLRLAANAELALEVKVAALTAGKIEVCMIMRKF